MKTIFIRIHLFTDHHAEDPAQTSQNFQERNQRKLIARETRAKTGIRRKRAATSRGVEARRGKRIGTLKERSKFSDNCQRCSETNEILSVIVETERTKKNPASVRGLVREITAKSLESVNANPDRNVIFQQKKFQ